MANQANIPSRIRVEGLKSGDHLEPLSRATILGLKPGTSVAVSDGIGREYFRAIADGEVSFIVAGALGMHSLRILGEAGTTLGFAVDAQTKVDDGAGGPFAELVAMLIRGMKGKGEGTMSRKFRGQIYRGYVHWILDHSHIAKGMQFFSDGNAGLVELERLVQREDGMIWSFIDQDPGPGYFDTRDAGEGYTRRGEGLLLVRQPVENHPEYNFVDALHLSWKASGDDEWMRRSVDSAMRALDYTLRDRARWSSKFGLLKRGYTIDSWDFQVKDQYSVPFPIGTDIKIDPDRTKFGIFFGDNTAYAQACEQLAEMLTVAGRFDDAQRYLDRAREIRARLDALAWNGRFYRHRIEEDPAVVRDLSVDESQQLAMSNTYTLNRGCGRVQAVAILKTYLGLKAHLPVGSPGEWYAIYPPFERGFGGHSGKWQYMNGGVHGHAAGELARGAFAHGFESYGVDILRRLLDLGRAPGGFLRFAYTGAIEPQISRPNFHMLDLAPQANMDLWEASERGRIAWMAADVDNDMRNLPVGDQVFAGIPFKVADAANNDRKSAIAVSQRAGFPDTVEVSVNRSAAAIYLLHSVNGMGRSGVAGALSLVYEDGTQYATYIMGTQVAGWWFPQLSTKTSGVAWRGPNPRSTDVGVCWAAIENPHPEKPIATLRFGASAEGAIYAVLGVTTADQMPIQPVDLVSTGGPDNWTGGTCTLALIEGLAGVGNAQCTTALRHVNLSPRWVAAEVKDVSVCVRYPASNGYVSYRYHFNADQRMIELTITGSGDRCSCHVLLPAGCRAVDLRIDGAAISFQEVVVESSRYANCDVSLPGPVQVLIAFELANNSNASIHRT